MEFDKQILHSYESVLLRGSLSQFKWCVRRLKGHGNLQYSCGKVMEKSWNFVTKGLWMVELDAGCFQSVCIFIIASSESEDSEAGSGSDSESDKQDGGDELETSGQEAEETDLLKIQEADLQNIRYLVFLRPFV